MSTSRAAHGPQDDGNTDDAVPAPADFSVAPGGGNGRNNGNGNASRRGVYRPRGELSAGELAHRIAAVIAHARRLGLADVLLDVSGVHGFESPGPAFRRWAVGLWSRTAARELCVAMLAREEHICPDKTGLLAAAEEGLHANIFPAGRTNDAIAWLDLHAVTTGR